MLGSLLASGSNATIDSNATVKTQMPQLKVFWTNWNLKISSNKKCTIQSQK